MTDTETLFGENGIGTEEGEESGGAKAKRERSPAFPFISLEKAIERAQIFAKDYRRNEARIVNVGAQWGFQPKSSTALQTVAALKYFGFMEETGGTKDGRKVKLTDLAWRILHDDRPGIQEKAIQEAALNPKIILEHWQSWGATRPPDRECLSELKMDKHFNPEAAQRFLTVYDETISFAKLAEDDTLHESDGNKISDKNIHENERIQQPLSIQPKGSEVDLMEDERVVYTYESQPENRVRLIVSGSINEELLDALEIYVTLQKKKLQAQKPHETRGMGRLPMPMGDQQPQVIQEPPHSLEHKAGER